MNSKWKGLETMNLKLFAMRAKTSTLDIRSHLRHEAVQNLHSQEPEVAEVVPMVEIIG
jgi:hypothetical protein